MHYRRRKAWEWEMWSRAVMSGKWEQTLHNYNHIFSVSNKTSRNDNGFWRCEHSRLQSWQTVKERILRLSLLVARPFFSISAYCKQLTTENSKGPETQLPYLSSEGSLFCLVAVLSCDSDGGGKVFSHILDVDGGWRYHHLCVCVYVGKRGIHVHLYTKCQPVSFTLLTKCTTRTNSPYPNICTCRYK